MEIYDLNNKFDFNNITLDNPYSIQGGSFFTKILFKDKPLCFQLPKCSTKQGLVETKKYKYFDLLYNNQENLIHWIENFENTCVEKINEKKNLWFSSEIDKDDIENLISPMLRIYSSGKKFILKTYIDVDKNTKNFNLRTQNNGTVLKGGFFFSFVSLIIMIIILVIVGVLIYIYFFPPAIIKDKVNNLKKKMQKKRNKLVTVEENEETENESSEGEYDLDVEGAR